MLHHRLVYIVIAYTIWLTIDTFLYQEYNIMLAFWYARYIAEP